MKLIKKLLITFLVALSLFITNTSSVKQTYTAILVVSDEVPERDDNPIYGTPDPRTINHSTII